MSRAEQLAKFLEEGDSKVLAELSKAVSSLEKSIDQRFEAFDEVIQSIGDAVESIEEKLESDDDGEEDDDKSELEAIKVEVKKAVEAVLRTRAPEPQKVDLNPLQKEINVLKSGLILLDNKHKSLQGDVVKLSTQLDVLIKAKRVPEFDKNGNVIAVRLEV